MLTSRDRALIDFLEQFGLISTKQAHKLFFSNTSERFCRHRLKKLTDQKHIKRDRGHIDQQYIYFINKLSQIEHRLKLVDLYIKMKKRYKIHTFKTEYTCGNLRADGYMEIQKDNLIYGYFIEVHLNNQFDQNKYEILYRSGEWRKSFMSFPRVLIITEKKVDLRPSNIRYIVSPVTEVNI